MKAWREPDNDIDSNHKLIPKEKAVESCHFALRRYGLSRRRYKHAYMRWYDNRWRNIDSLILITEGLEKTRNDCNIASLSGGNHIVCIFLKNKKIKVLINVIFLHTLIRIHVYYFTQSMNTETIHTLVGCAGLVGGLLTGAGLISLPFTGTVLFL